MVSKKFFCWKIKIEVSDELELKMSPIEGVRLLSYTKECIAEWEEEVQSVLKEKYKLYSGCITSGVHLNGPKEMTSGEFNHAKEKFN